MNETPIARFIDVGLPDGSLLLSLDGKTFRVKVTDVALDALVGAFAGEANDIVGELTVDGELVRIGEGTPFDPAFTQEALDASYSCDRSVILVPPT